MLLLVVARRLWRIVKHNPPDVTDFYSHAKRVELGLMRLVDPTQAEGSSYHSVSCHNSLEGMRAWQLRYFVSGYIAELEVPDDADVVEEPNGHCDLTGDPQVLLSYVVLPLSGEYWRPPNVRTGGHGRR